ncbi:MULTISPECIES: MDR family MFS transporter [Actinomadura]|uniref:MDR family MFS transporter n=1 Tax=Actinomadura yumaensis TaxID=111807 RepID=A0ABW2D168_9ACTN|nr:MDR family MFS transporter [Actinomadura sp. J1-007]
MVEKTETGARGLDPALRRLAGVLLVGAVGVVLDMTIVNVAVDRLSQDLHAPVVKVQWVVTGYLLAMGVATPVSGWGTARFGGRRMWLASLWLFLAGSVGCSTAWGLGSLIGFRVVQGVAGGLMLSTLQTLVAEAAEGRRLGQVSAVVSMPMLIGPIAGPTVGGLILSCLGWRWIFWLNVPFCVVGLALAWRHLPAGTARRTARCDVVGLLLVSPGVAALLYGLSGAHGSGGFRQAAVAGPLAAGAVLLTAFAVHAVRTSREPIIDVRLLRKRSFGVPAGLLFLWGSVLQAALLLLPLYFQRVHGRSALAAGLLMAPQGIGALLTRNLVGRLTDRVGARPVVVGGLVLATVGLLPFTQPTALPPLLVVAALAVRGAGLGGVFIPILAAAYQHLTPDQIPHASAITRLLQRIGGAMGTVLIVVVLQYQLAAARDEQATAFGRTFWWTLALTAATIIPALLLPGGPSRRVRALRAEESREPR